MKKVFGIILTSLFLFTSCQKEIDEETTVITGVEPPIVLVESELKGRIVNTDGEGIAGVEVSVRNKSTVSSSNGHFKFVSTEVKKESGLIKATLFNNYDGLASSNFTAEGSSYVEIVMLEKGESEIFNSTEGGQIKNENVEVIVEPDALIDADGIPYEGDFEISPLAIDPSADNFAKEMPADLTAIDENGENLVLSPLAMCALSVENKLGQDLEFAEGKEAEVILEIPPDLLDDAPSEADVYLYDLEKERWVKTGICNKSNGTYRCTARRGGYLVVCFTKPSVCLSGAIYNSTGEPSSYLKVIVEDLVDNFIYFGYTNLSGFFCGSVPRAGNLRLTVKDLCDNIVYTEMIGPFNEDFRLADIFLEDQVNDYVFNVAGTASQCDGSPLTKGHISVSYAGKIRIFPIQDGIFDFDMGLKCIEFPSLNFQAYSDNEKLSSFTFVKEEFGDIQLGDLMVCEDLDDQFSITADGQDYWTSPTRYYKKDNTSSEWWVLEGLAYDKKFTLDIREYFGVGSYTSNALFKIEDESNPVEFPLIDTASPAITVMITEDDGIHITGTLEGFYSDITGAQKAISGEFKIKVKK